MLTVFLCGDVMLGRGVDQILPHPGAPELREAAIRDARDYVRLAEAVSGPIPRPVDPTWPWGATLPLLEEAAPDVRILNLETSVTTDGVFAARKEVHYRMSPANLAALSVGRPDVCVLANNHVLDFGPEGLADTLDALSGAGLCAAGAGRDLATARRPAVVDVNGAHRVTVVALGLPSSGIPPHWAATAERPGVHYLPGLTADAADGVVAQVESSRQPGDLAVVSVHWGSNWGYSVSRAQVDFAHRLVDGGVDVVHGHSSHHPRPIEVYRDRLVLYGCGDFIDDYEGITGYEEFRPDLRLVYLVSVDADGRLVELRMVPLRAVRMRLEHATVEDADWLRDRLRRTDPGVRLGREADGTLRLRPDRRG